MLRPKLSAAATIRKWHPLPEWFRSQAATHTGAVLLETAKFDDENFQSFLFLNPVHEIVAHEPSQIDAAFQSIDTHVANGLFVAGFVAYECGEPLLGLPLRPTSSQTPLLRMGVFAERIAFDHRTGSCSHPIPAHDEEVSPPARVLESHLAISPEDHAARVKRVQQYLAAGHSYQVNFTARLHGTAEGSPAALYRTLMAAQPVSFGAFLQLGDEAILSLSPELFYRADGPTITVRPMKGTWPRGRNADEDARAAAMLAADPKNRAEHTTIVDLLRNDLGRIGTPGSIRVSRFMHVERFRTLHQMTSTITGSIHPGTTPSQVFRSLFPSGSITGAPKKRTMEIIRELEDEPRGPYTGAIGYFGPHGTCFNVAIRTLALKRGSFTCGVGGGITLDSVPADEYRECLLKASFLHRRPDDFFLFETMLATGSHARNAPSVPDVPGIPLLEAHLRRLCASAAYFGIPCDLAEIRRALDHTLRTLRTPSRIPAARLPRALASEWRVRLTLSHAGECAVTGTPLAPAPWGGRILLWPQPTGSEDPFLQHKTSRRELYNTALHEATERGFDEVLFQNEEGLITEGAVSNVFIRLHGAVLTPPTSAGALPGVQREALLQADPTITIRPFGLHDLLAADEIRFTNALRGTRLASTLTDTDGHILWRAPKR